MFSNCSSLIGINLGKLDFALDVIILRNQIFFILILIIQNHLNICFINVQNFKEINISKFKTTNYEGVGNMFSNCSSFESIDMLNWDIKNINNIIYLFGDCEKLRNIKMYFNNDKKLEFIYTFYGLPEGGSFVCKKGTNCNELLKDLPVSWNRAQE